MIGNYIGLLTNDCYLLICHSTPPFIQRSKINISDTLSPSSSPFAHISFYEQKIETNPYFKNIILSAFIESNVKLVIDAEEHLDILPFKFPRNFIILATTYTKDPNIFAFLILDFHQRRHVMLFDTENMLEIEREEVQNDSFSIITSSNIEEQLFEIFILAPHSITKYKGEKIEIENRLLTCFPLLNGEFIVQTDQGSIFGYDPNQNKLFKKGKLPIISIFHPIKNNHLICISESEDTFIIPFSLKYPVSEHSMEFQLLPRTNFYLNPRMLTAIFKNNQGTKKANLIAASDSKITSYSLTIPFSISKMEDLTSIFNDQITYIENPMHTVLVNDKIQIFAIKDVDSDKSEIIDFIATTKKYSTSFFGKVPISVNPTIDINIFSEVNIIQIHKKGIKSLNSDFEWNSNEKEIIAGSIGSDYIIAVLSDSKILVLDRNFQFLDSEDQFPSLDSLEGKVTTVAFCGNYIAVAANISDDNSNDGKKSSLAIFSIDFDRIRSQLFLLSTIVSLAYVPESQLLFASTSNGHVLSWRFDDSGYIDSDDCSTIFIRQNSPSSLVTLGVDLLIANDDGIFIYDGRKISPIQTGRVLSLCPVDDDSFFALMGGTLDVCRVRITRDANCLLKNFETCVARSPRRVLSESGGAIVSLCRSARDSVSCVDFFNQTVFNQFNFEFSCTYEPKSGECRYTPISMIDVPARSALVVGLVKSSASGVCGCLFVMMVEKETQTVSVVKKIDLQDIPYSMALISDAEVLVGVGKAVYVLLTKYWSLFEKPVAVLPTQTAFIDFFNGDTLDEKKSEKFVWIADRTQSVLCFRSLQSEFSQHTMLELVAVDSEQRQITAMQPLSDFVVAVGDKFGVIAVLRLPSGLIAGAPSWGEWKPPERGVSVPPGRRFEKVATFSVGQAVTSLLINKQNNLRAGSRRGDRIENLVFFYTTLFGQIGAVVQIASDEEFAILSNAARVAEKICNEEYGFLHMKRYQDGSRAVVATKYFDFIGQFDHEIQRKIEEALSFSYQQIQSLLCRYKAMATF